MAIARHLLALPLLGLASWLGYSGTGCAGKVAPPVGEIILALSTDTSVPEDIDGIELRIAIRGEIKLARLYKVSDGVVRMPATLAIVAGQDPSAPVTFLAIARKGEEAIVVNRVITTIPNDRIALLRMPLNFLCDSEETEIAASTKIREDSLIRFKKCKNADDGEDQTCRGGDCKDAHIDSSTLPTFDPSMVFGGTDGNNVDKGQCFDTVPCFANAPLVPINLGSCTISVPASTQGGGPLNVGLVTPKTGPGICSDSRCFIPLDLDPEYGFTLSGSTVTLPRGVCTRIQDGRVSGVALAKTCRIQKTSPLPVCVTAGSTGGTPPTVGSKDQGGLTAPDGGTINSGTDGGGANGAIYTDPTDPITADALWMYNGTAWTSFPAPQSVLYGTFTAAYDTTRDILVVLRNDSTSTTTLEWDGTTWRQVTTALSPTPRTSPGTAFDATLGKTVLFGGYNKAYLNDIWVYDTRSWNKLDTSATASNEIAAIYSKTQGGIVYWGGAVSTGRTNLIYSINPSNGAMARITTASNFMNAVATAFDGTRVIRFGGLAPSNVPIGTTEFLTGAVASVPATTGTPTARHHHCMAFDATLGRTVMFGGIGASPTVGEEAYTFDGAAWTAKPKSGAWPAPRSGCSMFYSPKLRQTILIGGATAL